MTEDEFEKLYFKAKLAGAKAIGVLMIELVTNDNEEFAFELIRKYSPGALMAPNDVSVSNDRPCKNSPYGLCYTSPLGRNIEQMDPDSMYCIWCDKIYSIDSTNSERKYIGNGHIIDDTSMLMADDLRTFVGYKNENTRRH